MTNEYVVPIINPKQQFENTIQFYNTKEGEFIEVLRISKDGITANPNVPVDEAAQAVLHAVDGYIKQLTQRTWVGLTKTEVVDLLCEYNKLTGNVGWQQLIYMTEAKLKEKNT